MPSVTVWTRLEPHPRDGSMQRSLQAQVRDPLWFLARQWQLGEFAGEDAGSPVQATMSVQSRPLTGYAPNDTASLPVAYDPTLPLEVHIERMPVTLNVRGSAQLGHRVEHALRAALSAVAAQAAIDALRTAYPIAPTAPADAAEDALGRAMRATLAGRVVDGIALASAFAAVQAGGTANPPLPPEAGDPQVAEVLADLVSYRASVYNEPTGDPAWRSRRLDYAATVTSTAVAAGAAIADTVTLVAPDFPGGELDWYSFALRSQVNPAAADTTAPEATVQTFNFLPTHVTFRGMPAPRWWEFEDAVTDFGAITPDKVDLATLLVMEFALVFGNDWFVVPLPTEVGTLSQISTLLVTDSFGIRTVIEPTESLGTDTGPVWSMFKLTGDGARSPISSCHRAAASSWTAQHSRTYCSCATTWPPWRGPSSALCRVRWTRRWTPCNWHSTTTRPSRSHRYRCKCPVVRNRPMFYRLTYRTTGSRWLRSSRPPKLATCAAASWSGPDGVTSTRPRNCSNRSTPSS